MDARATFDEFDANNNGVLDNEEARGLVEKLLTPRTTAELDDLVADMDSNGDGSICFAEFKDWLDARAKKDASAPAPAPDARP